LPRHPGELAGGVPEKGARFKASGCERGGSGLVRVRVALHHHALLTMIAFGFLVHLRLNEDKHAA